jgi:replication-associated recombination protein RarA
MENRTTNLLMHPQNNTQLNYILKDPPQALLISAPNGSGKKTLALYLAAQFLEIAENKNPEEHPYFFRVRRLKNKSDIAIEQIREIINALKLKVPGQQAVKRVIFIEDAQFLSIPAQNALLKNLEEPNPGTVFILSVNSPQNVLPTIASRTQTYDLQPVSLSAAVAYWDKKYEANAIESAWRLSGGAAGLMHALLSDDTKHPLKISVNNAKDFIKATKYQRILHADKLSRNKEQFQIFLDALGRTLGFLQQAAVDNGRDGQSKNILISRKAIKEAANALESNTNAKLVALKLVLGLKI